MFFFRLILSVVFVFTLVSGCSAAERLNRNGYLSITIEPILRDSNLDDPGYAEFFDQLYTREAQSLGESLAEGLESTAVRGRLRLLPGYRFTDHEAFRTTGFPDTLLVTVDLRIRYGLSKSSSFAACLSGLSCFLLSPVNLFTYQAVTDAVVSTFYFTPGGERLRLLQQTYHIKKEVPGDFYQAMSLIQEQEWVSLLTTETAEELDRVILDSLPQELLGRSWKQASHDLADPGVRRGGDLPPDPGIKPTGIRRTTEQTPSTAPLIPQRPLNLKQMVRVASQSVFKVVTERGSGSGFIISARGYGITNLHVVEGVVSITVRFHDGTTAEAQVAEQRSDLDLAVLEFAAEGRKPLPLGASDRVHLSDQITAIGYPLDFGLSVKPGQIVSKEIFGGIPLFHFEPEVPHGNSGGPLVNQSGEVVGIIFARTRGTDEPTTLALPIDQATPLLKRWEENKPR